MSKTNYPDQRLESIDALRGFDMLFIMGGAALVSAIASFWPESSFWQWATLQMSHVPWEGMRHHDTIFPLFLFIAGISFPFSLNKQRSKGKTTSDIVRKIIIRGLMLVFLGLLYNGLLNFKFSTLRFPSVLARIGLAWMFAALAYTFIHKKAYRVLLAAVLLIGYWLVMANIPSPTAPPGADIFSKEGSIACYLDPLILGAHSYRDNYDPEGILSTIPAISTALLGMLAGDWVRYIPKKSNSLLDKILATGSRKALTLAVTGAVLWGLGLLWGKVFPINKALWSSSFVLAVGGYSFLMFALFYYIIDVLKWRKWDKFFVVIGLNSITIYLGQRFIAFWETQHRVFDGLRNLFAEGSGWYNLIDASSYILVCWLFLYFLYKQKIFLKV
ncbi:MAG: DUF5009 domain-containing protein [Bacteroidaceae bacterium]|nr:DUF5009 domain-containing protein [Bacteroidaceae bacterium]